VIVAGGGYSYGEKDGAGGEKSPKHQARACGHFRATTVMARPRIK